MGRILLLLYCATISILAEVQCPKGYDAMGDGRCIRALYVNQYDQLGKIFSNATNECAKDGATLPIIRSDEENAMFSKIVTNLTSYSTTSPYLVLGMVCNSNTRKLEWQDGTKIEYTYKGFNAYYDCVTNDNRVVSRPNTPDWVNCASAQSAYYTMLCVLDPTEDCGEYEQISDNDDRSKPCFKIFSEPMSWRDAQKHCSDDFGSLAAINSAQENKFFWRSTVSNNVLDDVHIGVYQTPEDGNWKWIDNSNASDYSNFHKAFPILNGGSCTAMLTESSTAQWINEDCDHQKLPFICRRAGFQSYPKECSAIDVVEGKEILAPGFPTPDVPCEFVMAVDANNLVQLEVLTLETIPNKDFLQIYEGAVGKKLLANLTGWNPNSSKVLTKSTNVMRVNWKPSTDKRSPEYRGFRIRYNAVLAGK